MTRTYYLEDLRRNLLLVGATIIAGLGVAYAAFGLFLLGRTPAGLGPIDWLIIGVPTAFLLGVGLMIALAARSIRLELSQEGIELHLPGGLLAAEWGDVAAIALAPWGPLSGEALVLRRPARFRRPIWWPILGDPEMERSIPLSAFALPLHGSRLEADLRSRLPELFD
jgi:hypothetical protein